ncbi:class I SAM-dependent methyltransferase [Fundidesulfovibrio terrae]|uniref:class I SAM-dependent methyltransferase n=1 Tax=Fundidesulfovibrio terrae TaxID=2922866 RepID=UPI001FB04265|nr:class I SAM-dependent methyltransferase [Fundidesulfovibrio terrae]
MDIVVWGTGKDAVEMLGHLELEDINLLAFVDENAQAGATFLNRQVIRPEMLGGQNFDALFITSARWEEPRRRALEDCGVPEDKIHAYHHKRFGLLRRFGKKGVLPGHLTDDDIAALDSKAWYHQVDLFPGVTTPGPASLQGFLLDQVGPRGFEGKRVLDIGAWTGPYSFEVERRGGVVTSYDIQDPETSGYNLLRALKGSNAEYVRDSVYNLSTHFRNHFDVILFFGVFYHLKNPVWAFENIHAALKDGGIMLYEGAVLEYAYTLDPVWAARKDRMQPYLEVPMAYYTTGDCLGHFSNWYVPNVLCLREWITSSGFETKDMYLLPGGSRAYGSARKLADVPLEHSS